MNSESTRYWTTLLANIAVIIGLLFLTYELRQTSAIATTQLRFSYGDAWRNLDASRQASDFADTLNRSLKSPESLTKSEIIRLDAYYTGVVDQMYNAQVAYDSELRGTSLDSTVKQAVNFYFDNEFAQIWWDVVKEHFDGTNDSLLLELMDLHLTNLRESRVDNRFKQLHERMQSEFGTNTEQSKNEPDKAQTN